MDIWSTGCIFAELLRFTNKYQNCLDSKTQRYLFAGTSCFPISACPEAEKDPSTVILEEKDQMVQILSVIDAPQKYVTGKPCENYMEKVKDFVTEKTTLD